MSKIYVGNLSWGTTDDTLRAAFAPFGPVLDVIVMKDPQTQRSRGFGFVTFSSQQEADTAISSMNDQELDGRRLKVNVANQRTGGGGGGGASQGGYQQGGGFQGSQGGFNGTQGYQQPPQPFAQGYGQGYGNQGFNQGGYGQPGGYQGNWPAPQQGFPQGGYNQDGSQTGYNQFQQGGYQGGYGGGYNQ